LFLILYVVQYFFVPVLMADSIFATIFGNTLYLVAFVYYYLITFLGYNGMF